MRYLLDTNACIAFVSGRSSSLRERVHSELDRGAVLGLSSVVLFELWYGIGKSSRRAASIEGLGVLLNLPLEVLSFDPEDARSAGELRAELHRIGKPIGPYDTLIAGQALRHGLTLVTANIREFARVPGLRWEDWAASS